MREDCKEWEWVPTGQITLNYLLFTSTPTQPLPHPVESLGLRVTTMLILERSKGAKHSPSYEPS
jgi:hypothetical protein